MIRPAPRLAIATLLAAGPAAALSAQGHGPLYGLSTPTLGRGEWSLDVGGMVRRADGGRSALMLRPMLAYGVLEDVQISVSAPLPIQRDALPVVRGFTRMPATRDAEVMVGWRVHRRGTGVGTRRETTLWLAADVPVDDTRAGLETAPALFGSAVTGYASRSLYAWVGGGYRRALESGEAAHRAGDVGMGSLVLGYRPRAFRADYPHPDWRAFVEVVGERVSSDTVDGVERPDTGGTQVYAALTLLGLYGSWGVSGGPAFPLYQELNGAQPEEGARLAVNATLWFQ